MIIFFRVHCQLVKLFGRGIEEIESKHMCNCCCSLGELPPDTPWYTTTFTEENKYGLHHANTVKNPLWYAGHIKSQKIF